LIVKHQNRRDVPKIFLNNGDENMLSRFKIQNPINSDRVITSNSNRSLHASRNYTRQRNAENEELVVYIQTCIERYSKSDAVAAEEIVVRLERGFELIIIRQKKKRKEGMKSEDLRQ